MLGSKRCVVKVAYGGYRKGAVIYPSAMLRDQLLRSGYIEIVPEPAQSDFANEVQTTEPPRETATRRRRSTAWDR